MVGGWVCWLVCSDSVGSSGAVGDISADRARTSRRHHRLSRELSSRVAIVVLRRQPQLMAIPPTAIIRPTTTA